MPTYLAKVRELVFYFLVSFMSQPNKSSNPPPSFCPPSVCPIGACVLGSVVPPAAASAPQMPALVFCFAKSASLGPWVPGVAVFLIPAVALAVDHREPNASAPADDDFAWAGLLNEGVKAVGDLMPAGEGWEAAWDTGTEVK